MIATWTSTSTFRGSSSYASRPFRGRNTLSLNMRETSTCDPPFPNPPPTLLLSSPFLNPLRHPGSCAIHQMGDRSKGHFLRTARWAPRSRGAARGSARSTPKRTPRLAVRLARSSCRITSYFSAGRSALDKHGLGSVGLNFLSSFGLSRIMETTKSNQTTIVKRNNQAPTKLDQNPWPGQINWEKLRAMH